MDSKGNRWKWNSYRKERKCDAGSVILSAVKYDKKKFDLFKN
jgi:hypothetical protein